jgi:hypothetical protein
LVAPAHSQPGTRLALVQVVSRRVRPLQHRARTSPLLYLAVLLAVMATGCGRLRTAQAGAQVPAAAERNILVHAAPALKAILHDYPDRVIVLVRHW